MSASNTLLTPKDMAERLGIPERSVRQKVYGAVWPHRRLDLRTIRFTEDDFRTILTMSYEQPHDRAAALPEVQRAPSEKAVI
ncbi:hypothetical protein SAMN04489742_3633 [Arthrobacter crystallopoietes]|uniref:DNA binding domain-containing protein, excisionase family n=1 Tax=Crystallibacter crystallopoietes TaxID=37928 RepID=A0A1H1FT30_9MICC|nr:hypothetical protein SAMN04489742_3633 [Arthrobacter crystallopoietes]